MDREAMSSQIFIQAPTPIPDASKNAQNNSSSKNSSTDSDKNQNDTTDDANKKDDDADAGNNTNNPTTNLNNSYGGGGTFTSSRQLKFTKQNDDGYSYTIANGVNEKGSSPFATASDSNSIQISINTTTYNQIAFCEPDNFTNCSSVASLPLTINNDTIITNLGYSKQAISGQPGASYYIANLYIKLTNSGNSNNLTKTIQFPINCTTQSDSNADLSCNISSTASVAI